MVSLAFCRVRQIELAWCRLHAVDQCDLAIVQLVSRVILFKSLGRDLFCRNSPCVKNEPWPATEKKSISLSYLVRVRSLAYLPAILLRAPCVFARSNVEIHVTTQSAVVRIFTPASSSFTVLENSLCIFVKVPVVAKQENANLFEIFVKVLTSALTLVAEHGNAVRRAHHESCTRVCVCGSSLGRPSHQPGSLREASETLCAEHEEGRPQFMRTTSTTEIPPRVGRLPMHRTTSER